MVHSFYLKVYVEISTTQDLNFPGTARRPVDATVQTDRQNEKLILVRWFMFLMFSFLTIMSFRGMFQSLVRKDPSSFFIRTFKPSSTSSSSSSASSSSNKRRQAFHRQQQIYFQNPTFRNRHGPLDIARFALLSIATLPFTLLVAKFSYDYFYRVELCLESLTQKQQQQEQRQEDNDNGNNQLPYTRQPTRNKIKTKSHTLSGRERQRKEIETLLAKDPHQLILVAGGNEAGKSFFISDLLNGLDKDRNYTHIQLAQLVDSISNFTYILVESFNLSWLAIRYSFIDILPFAGSEILVMKERYSDRDLAQALRVITAALKRHNANSTTNSIRKSNNNKKPIIVIDGLDEGKQWTRTQEGKQCLQRLFQWCVYVTKERNLAHIILTGDEELVLNLTDQNRLTRGHVKIIGLGDVSEEYALELVFKEIPDVTLEEAKMITDTFGGCIHDVIGSSRDIQDRLVLLNESSTTDKTKIKSTRSHIFHDVINTRYWMHIERVSSAFAKGRGDAVQDSETSLGNNGGSTKEEEDHDMDPFLDPLKEQYSEAQASQTSLEQDENNKSGTASYSELQLWQILQRLVDSSDSTAGYAELRDDIFGGDHTALLELMDDDVISFDFNHQSSNDRSWKVKPASPVLAHAFRDILRDGFLSERFSKVERQAKRREECQEINKERMVLLKEMKALEQRKAALLNTVELGKELGYGKGILSRLFGMRNKVADMYESLVMEEHDVMAKDKELRMRLKALDIKETHGALDSDDIQSVLEAQTQMKNAIQQLMSRSVPAGSDTSKDPKSSRLRKVFEELDAAPKDGKVTAEDIALLVKETTGQDVEIKLISEALETWDINKDKQIDFEEFQQMVLQLSDDDKDGN